jgi:dTDP-D-glucose 4,6-dehydratase
VKILATGGAGFIPSSYKDHMDDGIETTNGYGAKLLSWRFS